MFIDEAVIEVKAGDGGNGCFSYERQKYKPRGRPDGGNGGRGGHIYVMCSPDMHTLQDAAYHRHYKALRGAHGKGSNKTGRNGPDIVITVPVGTIISDSLTNEIIADCVVKGKKVLVARGGRGGRGNASLASVRNPNPERSEAGKEGEKILLRLELKVLADVGLVGRPNAGKSTFLSRISHARPKVADYPFTTKKPHLGIVTFPELHHSFVVADIPGLIENCHLGKGLGIRFLKHIERTRVLAILVEATSPDPHHDVAVLLEELSCYSKLLADKPKCFILTKCDLIGQKENVDIPEGWFMISAVTGEGVKRVLTHLLNMLRDSMDDN